MKEIWKKVESFPHYEVSNLGRVRRYNISHSNHHGYMFVYLSNNATSRINKPRLEYVHRLVAKAFIPNSDKKETVNHKNGIKIDNRVENLEWMTKGENSKHAYETGLVEVFKNRTKLLTKYTEVQIKQVISLAGTMSAAEAARRSGISRAHVQRIWRNEAWQFLPRIPYTPFYNPKAMTHCKRGHKFTEQNTYIYNGNRKCKTCTRNYGKSRRAAKKLSKMFGLMVVYRTE